MLAVGVEHGGKQYLDRAQRKTIARWMATLVSDEHDFGFVVDRLPVGEMKDYFIDYAYAIHGVSPRK